jgi:hypothetical protein
MQGTTSALVPIAPGGPYHQLRVRAENQLGVAAESPAGDPFQLAVHDDSDSAITYPTAWAQTSDTTAFDGKLHTTGSVGANVGMTFTGRSIAVVSPVGPTSGSIQICIDATVAIGSCTIVTEHSASAVAREVVYVSGPLAAGMHTATITSVASGSGAVFALDAFAVLG